LPKRRRPRTRLQKSFDEVEARQQNITWPNYVSNARSVDEALLKGSPNAPMVQRVGAWLFGLAFILAAVGMVIAGFLATFVERLICTGFILLGVHTFMIGCRKHK
jgi:MFS family permease